MIKGIIVEGSDCAGKTTLIQSLKVSLSHSGWDISILGHREVPQFDRYMKAYTNANKVIFDRGHFSEIVYGDLWRGGNAIGSWEQSFLNSYVFENFLVIFVQAPIKTLKERYSAREHGQTVTEQELELVQARFASLLSHQTVLCYDASSPASLDSFVKKILNVLHTQGLNQQVVKKNSKPAHDKKTFILLEGTNGSGKSTLSKLLKISMVGWGVKTLDYKSVNPFQRYLYEYSNNSEIIFDRGHFSEIVYGNIFRSDKHFSPLQLDLLNEYVRNRGIVVLCDPPLDVLVHRVTNTEYPKHIHESRLGQVREKFKNALQQANIPFYHVDTANKKNVHDVIELITQSLLVEPYSKMGWEKQKESSL